VDAGAGVIAKDNPQDQAKAILKLLKDKKLFDKMKKNAINRARDNTWENTYMKAFKETGFDLA
jgi:glycosyltransferase involved in cell wall biosynthesis